MILYHGSNVEVRHPKLLKNQRALDFDSALRFAEVISL